MCLLEAGSPSSAVFPELFACTDYWIVAWYMTSRLAIMIQRSSQVLDWFNSRHQMVRDPSLFLVYVAVETLLSKLCTLRTLRPFRAEPVSSNDYSLGHDS